MPASNFSARRCWHEYCLPPLLSVVGADALIGIINYFVGADKVSACLSR